MQRQPAVAGTFYPFSHKQPHQMLDRYLLDAKTDALVPKAIIAPHAGYIYSGPIAASAYARLKKSQGANLSRGHCRPFTSGCIQRTGSP